jgi:hypothetical protein
MSLAVDASRAFRSPHELTGLIEAVLGASENDESDWVEWKSGLTLSEKDTQGTLARHVLGMANRRPELAARYAAGCGYIIAGAEPGNCAGVTEVDPAVLSQGMRSYLGAEGPGWGAQYLNREGVSVLVVTVEPPRSGDRIFTLQKAFGKYLAGAVFVRRPGRTDQAGPDDIRALEDRFAAGGAETAERARRVKDLREIGALIERIISLAKEHDDGGVWWRVPQWTCEEQRVLPLLLAGLGSRCRNAGRSRGRAGRRRSWQPPVMPAMRSCRL